MLRDLLPAPSVVEELEPADWAAPLDPREATIVAAAPERRRREFAAGRSCARRALARLGHYDAAVFTGPEREPVFPPGVVGAITHTGRFGAVAVAPAARIAALGIDAERDRPFEPTAVAMVCTEAERRALPSGGAGSWPAVAFSAKESLFKAWFPLAGRRIGFHDAVVALDAARGTFVARVLVTPPPRAAALGAGVEGRFAIRDGLILTALAVPVESPRPATLGT